MERDERLYDRLRRLPIPDRLVDALGVEPVLSPPEREVLQYASHGLTMQQTADAMQLGYQTVLMHRRAAIGKLHAKNTAHAIGRALRADLFP